MPEPPYRCSVCGLVAPPDHMKTQLDPRYATGYCVHCHEHRALIRAATIEEATRGYHALQAERERRTVARQELKKSMKETT